MNKLKRVSSIMIFVLILAMVAPTIMPTLSNTTTVEAATKVKITKSKVTITIGKTSKLQVSGTTKTVTWSTSDKTVATVSSKGKVTAKAVGTATITATVDKKNYTCKVTVKEVAETTVYGKVTAISGSKVTIALGTMKEQGGTPPSGTAPTGTPSASTDAAASSSTDSTQSGTQQSSAPEFITLTGKSIDITISDTSIISKQSMQVPNGTTTSDTSSNTATLTDIGVGSILKVTYSSSIKNLTSVVIISTSQPGGTQPGGTTGTSSNITTGTGAYNLTSGEVINGGTFTSMKEDENAVRADNSITASLTDAIVSKTAGAASSSDASSFYGLNAAMLALGGSTLNITGGSVTATAEGSNGVFAYDGATVNIKNTLINVTGGNAGGIEVAGGGILNATNLTVYSKVKAAIRSDRGGGTMTVNGGTYTTSGSSGAPAVYSTADITVNDATLTANTSEAIVVEGLNSVTLDNCEVSGNMSGTYGSSSSENIHNVMLYQSMSGDAQVGNSTFKMTDGSLTSNNGDMFYVTNTDCAITLYNVALDLADNTKLLVVAGNDASKGWGTVGSNGGDCSFKVAKQTLTGDITVDSISKLDMTLSDSSSFTGSINSDGTTASALSVTLDSSSTWTLTADSYITAFTGNMSNVITNGHILFVNGVAQN
jgi:hypothetical protein